MSSATKGQRIRRIALILCSSLSTASGFGRNPIAFPVPFEWRGGEVDLGAIGRFFGLEPATVRLNGHFLSRGSDFISSVTWDSLISFFSARGFPAGESDRDPIVVQGKPYVAPGLHSASDLEVGDHLSFKRKIRLEDESPSKKNRVFEESSGLQEVKNGVVSDDESICIGRTIKLDDNHPSKKPKVSKCNSGLASEASKLPIFASSTGFTYNCINGLGKRLREDEMAVPISCEQCVQHSAMFTTEVHEMMSPFEHSFGYLNIFKGQSNRELNCLVHVKSPVGGGCFLWMLGFGVGL